MGNDPIEAVGTTLDLSAVMVLIIVPTPSPVPPPPTPLPGWGIPHPLIPSPPCPPQEVVDFTDPLQFPPNPNGYIPITILEVQTPINEFNLLW